MCGDALEYYPSQHNRVPSVEVRAFETKCLIRNFRVWNLQFGAKSEVLWVLAYEWTVWSWKSSVLELFMESKSLSLVQTGCCVACMVSVMESSQSY